MKRYVWAGFISFFMLELAGILYAYTLGRFDSFSYSAIQLLIVSLIFSFGVGLFGILFGIIFQKFLIDRPTQNAYFNASFWMVIIDLGLSVAMKE